MGLFLTFFSVRATESLFISKWGRNSAESDKTSFGSSSLLLRGHTDHFFLLTKVRASVIDLRYLRYLRGIYNSQALIASMAVWFTTRALFGRIVV